MNNINEMLPFIIPLVIVQFGFLAYTLYHILTHKHYCIWRVPTAGFAEQNGRNAKLNSR